MWDSEVGGKYKMLLKTGYFQDSLVSNYVSQINHLPKQCPKCQAYWRCDAYVAKNFCRAKDTFCTKFFTLPVEEFLSKFLVFWSQNY